MHSLFVLIFGVLKIIEKLKIAKNNRKQTAIISHQKIFNYRKNIESIGPAQLSHRNIASHLACIIAKCIRCVRLPWFYGSIGHYNIYYAFLRFLEYFQLEYSSVKSLKFKKD